VDISIRAERSSGVANATTDERSLFIQLAAGGHLFAHVWFATLALLVCSQSAFTIRSADDQKNYTQSPKLTSVTPSSFP
jgi:hypothetical protein